MKYSKPVHFRPFYRNGFIPRFASLLVLAAAIFSLPVMANSNPDIEPHPVPRCMPADGNFNSFYWFYQIGTTSYKKPNMLQIARLPATHGYSLGNNPTTFDRTFASSYTTGVTNNRAGVSLTIEKDDLDATVLQASTLKIKRDALMEVIELLGTIRQVRTLDTLADVVSLPAGGYHVKIYDRTAVGPKGSGANALYSIPFGLVPLQEWIMRTPDGQPFSNTVEAVTIDRRNMAGVLVEVRRFSVDAVADTRLKETYAGSLDGSGNVVVGDLLETDKVTYQSRGAKTYDYTLVREVKRVTTTASGADFTSPLLEISKRLEEYRDFTPTGEPSDSSHKRRVREVDGYGSADELETLYEFYDVPENPLIHGRLKSKVMPDGNWEYNEYTDSEGAATFQQVKYSAWKDVLMANRTNARREVVSVASTTNFTKTVRHGGEATSRETFSSIPDASGFINTLTMQGGQDQPLSVRTWKIHPENAAEFEAGRIAWMENPDGTADAYTYSSLSGGSYKVIHRKGLGTRSGVNVGTEITTEYNSFDEAYLETEKDIASGLLVRFWTAPMVDAIGRPSRIEYNGDSDDYETFQYSCCGLELKRNRDGSMTQWSRDPLKRVYRQTDSRYAGDPSPLVTGTRYEGLTTTATREGIVQSETSLLLNGTVASVKSPDRNGDGIAEATSMIYSSGGRIITTTYPDGGNEVRENYLDGQIKSVTGSSVPDRSYSYGTHTLGGNGLWTLETRLTATGGTDEWVKIYRDALNRPLRTERPYGATLATENSSYNSYMAVAGKRTQLASHTDADGKQISYDYDGKGNLKTVTEQMSDSQSRITATVHDVVNDGTLGVCKRTTTTVNGVETGVTLRSGDGYASRSTSFGLITSSVRTPATAAGNFTVTTVNPDSTRQVATTTGNLLEKVEFKDSSGNNIHSTVYAYDGLRRLLSSTDSRTGTTWFAAMVDDDADPLTPLVRGSSALMTEANSPTYISDPAGRITTFTYDVMGRRVSVDAPDTADASGNPLSNITHTSWYPTGLEKAVWGDQTSATFKVHDEQGRLEELRTYQSLALGSEPTAATTGDNSTTWEYHPQSGLLSRKEYADTKGNDYTYTAGGRLETRLWARGITTTYHYDKGLLTFTDYSDATPDVTLTYDAFGRQQTVTQNQQSQIAFTYDPANLAIDTETIRYDLNHDGIYDFTRVIDRRPLDSGRDTGWELKDDSTIENQVTYGYSATTGRLKTVTDASSGLFTYGYLANSSLVETVTASTGAIHTVTNTWELTRNVLDVKENRVGSTDVSTYDYIVNAIGQRTNVATGGSAFPAMPTWLWGYDSLGQVIRADSSVNSSDRAYQYDAIGNRKKSANSLILPASDNYSANSVNQYTAVGAVNPSYDDDGNATAYPLPTAPSANSSLNWDAENRLVETQVAGSGPLVQTLYDAQSRRISETVDSITTLFVYDGWNCIAEYTAAALSKTRLWGLDLSGTLQGAGGVGGLLSETQIATSPATSNSYFPTYDGNGNVSEYLDATGQTIAHFEYDPFGNIVVNTDTSNQFAYRFSTKPLNFATGFYYYGYRWYDPATGRWPSRDPIEEEGGMNLYAFVGNGGINGVDYLGLMGPHPPIDDGSGPGVVPPDDYESNSDRAKREQREAWESPCDEITFFEYEISDLKGARVTVSGRPKYAVLNPKGYAGGSPGNYTFFLNLDGTVGVRLQCIHRDCKCKETVLQEKEVTAPIPKRSLRVQQNFVFGGPIVTTYKIGNSVSNFSDFLLKVLDEEANAIRKATNFCQAVN